MDPITTPSRLNSRWQTWTNRHCSSSSLTTASSRTPTTKSSTSLLDVNALPGREVRARAGEDNSGFNGTVSAFFDGADEFFQECPTLPMSDKVRTCNGDGGRLRPQPQVPFSLLLACDLADPVVLGRL
jgi:hypothetical protein